MSTVQVNLSMDEIAAFCIRWKVRELALFGSVLREDFRADSDIDVLVSFEESADRDLWDLCTMRDELEAVFGRKVDIAVKEALRNPFRRHAILSSREIVYAA